MTIAKSVSTSLIVGLLLLTLGLTTIVAFGQQDESSDISFTTEQEGYMMGQLQNNYGWDCSTKEACGEAFKKAAEEEGYDVLAERMHALMKEAGGLFKGVEKKYENVANVAGEVNLNATGEIALIEANKAVDLFKEANLTELASAVTGDIDVTDAVSRMANDGVQITLEDGKIFELTESNIGEAVASYGIGIFDKAKEEMAEMAKGYGMSEENFADFYEHMNNTKQHFTDTASKYLPELVGPPVFTGEDGEEGDFSLPPGMNRETMMELMQNREDGTFPPSGESDGDNWGGIFDRFSGGDYSGETGDHGYVGGWKPSEEMMQQWGEQHPYDRTSYPDVGSYGGTSFDGTSFSGEMPGGGDHASWSSGGADGGLWGAWTAPEGGGWTGGSYDAGGGGTDYSSLSPEALLHTETQMMQQYDITAPAGDGMMTPMIHSGALLYILLDLLR